MLKKIGIGAAVVVALFVVVVATRPGTFHYERSTTIAAPPETVYALISDFHNWEKWSPWEKLDPAMKRTYDGAPSGAGAKYGWTGNDKVGEGRMTIEEAKASERVKIKLEFLKPFETTNTTTFTLAPEGTGVKVTWGMDGNNNFGAKAFGLFVDMEKMIAGDFDRGLANMKAAAESAPKKPEAPKADPGK